MEKCVLVIAVCFVCAVLKDHVLYIFKTAFSIQYYR